MHRSNPWLDPSSYFISLGNRFEGDSRHLPSASNPERNHTRDNQPNPERPAFSPSPPLVQRSAYSTLMKEKQQVRSNHHADIRRNKIRDLNWRGNLQCVPVFLGFKFYAENSPWGTAVINTRIHKYKLLIWWTRLVVRLQQALVIMMMKWVVETALVRLRPTSRRRRQPWADPQGSNFNFQVGCAVVNVVLTPGQPERSLSADLRETENT